ncbi:MAG TPA: sensor histidine kinase [Vicinamibacterales bacterium]
MVRRPATIRTALLGGFLVIFAVWLGSTLYFTGRLAESQAQSAAIQSRLARGQELLFAIQNQVLVGSIYIRDALMEGQDPAAIATAREQLRGLQRQVTQELEQYERSDSVVDLAAWTRLKSELAGYWEASIQLLAPESEKRGQAQARLETQVAPRRDVVVALSDEIRQVMTGAFTREQRDLNEADRRLRGRIWETTALAGLIGAGIAVFSAWYVGRLEATVREGHAEVARNREELRHLSGKLVRAQEDERRSIARELHDEIGQALTAVEVELAVAEGAASTNPAAVEAIHEARTVTQRALSGVRDLSQLLRPSMLDDFGLPDTLKWQLRKFSDRTNVRTELVQDGLSERLPIDVEVTVYRVIQEALTNVSRHAKATTCRVFVQRLASSVVVTIEDDGVGLPDRANSHAQQEGSGLVGIRERVSDLGGTFRIEGKTGKGTRLLIELPVTASV